MAYYLFRRGDGNEGDFPLFIVWLKGDESPYAALPALLANRLLWIAVLGDLPLTQP